MFEVPTNATGAVEPVPIKQMGRFVHEACPVDPRTGIVYMTEDNGDPADGFYRYLPDHKGKLHLGGKLQMLAIKDRPKYNTVTNQTVGEKLECRWVDIEDPDPSGADRFPQAVYMQGRKKGGARFMGLEGGTFSKGSCYFCASDGGNQEQGQVWRYTPDNKDFKRGTPRPDLRVAEAPGPDRPRRDRAEPARRRPALRGRRRARTSPARRRTCATSPPTASFIPSVA